MAEAGGATLAIVNEGGQAAQPGGGKSGRPLLFFTTPPAYDPEKDFDKESKEVFESRREAFVIPRWADGEKRTVENSLDARLMIAAPSASAEDPGKIREASLSFQRIAVRSFSELKNLSEATKAVCAHSVREAASDPTLEPWIAAARGLVAMRLMESGRMTLQEGTARLREGGYFADPFLSFETGALSSSDMSLLGPNDEFIPLAGGPGSKQLYLYDMLLAHARAFEAINHNPIAKQIVELTTNFVLGRGVRAKANHPRVQELWDQFWKANRMDERLRTWMRDLSWQGELFVRCFPGGPGGMVVRELDSSSIWEVVTNPEDIEEVYYYHQQFSSAFQTNTRTGIDSSRYVVRQIPAAEMEHLRVNISSGEKRGRSDLYSLLTWLKRVKDYYNAVVVRAQEEASHCREIILDGSDADVQAAASDPQFNQPPPPGSNWIHNRAVEVKPSSLMHGDLGSGSRDIGGQILGVIAVGASMPPPWLSFTGTEATRANTLTAAEPATQHFGSRQRLCEIILQRMKDRVLPEWKRLRLLPDTEVEKVTVRALIRLVRDQKFGELVTVLGQVLTGGGLARKVPLDTGIEFIFPEVKTSNRTEKIKDIQTAEAGRHFSHERSSNMIAAELEVTTYDFQEEMAAIQEEVAAGIGPPQLGLEDDLVGDHTETPGEPAPQAGSDANARGYRDRMGTA
jgi:hypothetical protein